MYFWIQHCYELLWTLHCPKGRYCDVTIIRPLLFHGMRTDLRGSPGAAIVDCQSIYYLLDFKRIYFIFPWNNSTYDLDATVGWLESLGYSINARDFGPRTCTPYLAVGLAGVTMCIRVNNYLWNHVSNPVDDVANASPMGMDWVDGRVDASVANPVDDVANASPIGMDWADGRIDASVANPVDDVANASPIGIDWAGGCVDANVANPVDDVANRNGLGWWLRWRQCRQPHWRCRQ